MFSLLKYRYLNLIWVWAYIAHRNSGLLTVARWIESVPFLINFDHNRWVSAALTTTIWVCRGYSPSGCTIFKRTTSRNCLALDISSCNWWKSAKEAVEHLFTSLRYLPLEMMILLIGKFQWPYTIKLFKRGVGIINNKTRVRFRAVEFNYATIIRLATWRP